MEGSTQPAPKKPLAFHSGNIADTKSKTKREVFVNVEQKKTIKQSAAEFQKKFAEAKAHAAESRAKIENPGADENGVIRSRIPFVFPWKATIICLVIIGLGIGIYLAYPTIAYHLMPSEQRGFEILLQDKTAGIEYLTKLADRQTTANAKATILVNTGEYLLEKYDDAGEDIRQLAYKAEKLAPSIDTAVLIWRYQQTYGTEEEATNWLQIIEERGGNIYGGNG